MASVVSFLNISSLEKKFDSITPLAEIDIVFGVKVEFIEGRHTIFYGEFLDILKTHIFQAQIFHDNSCFMYPLTEYISVIREVGRIMLGIIFVMALAHM